ncbi:MAG: hypothetical protein ACPGR8_17255 [Limisphaerales bacterium]
MSSTASHAGSGRKPAGARWIAVGRSPAGSDIRLEGRYPGPMKVVRPNARMRTLGCTACFRRHDKRNMACAAATGIRGPTRKAGVYALRSGEPMGWRISRIDRNGHAWLR